MTYLIFIIKFIFYILFVTIIATIVATIIQLIFSSWIDQKQTKKNYIHYRFGQNRRSSLKKIRKIRK